MTDHDNADETDGQNSKLSRRTALGLMGASAVGGAAASSAYSELRADRPIDVDVVDEGPIELSEGYSELIIENNADESFSTAITTTDSTVFSPRFIGGDGAELSGTNQSWDLANLGIESPAAIEFQRPLDSSEVDFDVEAFTEADGFSIALTQDVDVDSFVHFYLLDDWADDQLETDRVDDGTVTYKDTTGYYRPEWTIEDDREPSVSDGVLELDDDGEEGDAQLTGPVFESIDWENDIIEWELEAYLPTDDDFYEFFQPLHADNDNNISIRFSREDSSAVIRWREDGELGNNNNLDPLPADEWFTLTVTRNTDNEWTFKWETETDSDSLTFTPENDISFEPSELSDLKVAFPDGGSDVNPRIRKVQTNVALSAYLTDDWEDDQLESDRENSNSARYNGTTGFDRPEWTIESLNPSVSDGVLELGSDDDGTEGIAQLSGPRNLGAVDWDNDVVEWELEIYLSRDDEQQFWEFFHPLHIDSGHYLTARWNSESSLVGRWDAPDGDRTGVGVTDGIPTDEWVTFTVTRDTDNEWTYAWESDDDSASGTFTPEDDRDDRPSFKPSELSVSERSELRTVFPEIKFEGVTVECRSIEIK